MFYTNAKFYTLTSKIVLDFDLLEEVLADNAFRPCGSQDIATMGFGFPIGSQLHAHTANGFITLVLKKQEKLLPNRVINAKLSERIEAVEIETGAPVGKKAQADIKQEIITRLLPQAFTVDTYIYGTVVPQHNLVIVNANSDAAAESFLAMVRKALGSLPVVPLARLSLQSELTHWLNDSTPEEIRLTEEAELKSTDELGSVIRCKNQPLDSDEIKNHLESGKQVQRVGIEIEDQFSAVFSEDGSLKRIRFADRLIEENDDIPKDQVAARFDANILLGVSTLVHFVELIREHFKLNEVEKITESKERGSPFFGSGKADAFYNEAVEFVIQTRRASVSSIQRKFRIGYNRAARMIEQMEVDGVISGPGHNGAREVLKAAA